MAKYACVVLQFQRIVPEYLFSIGRGGEVGISPFCSAPPGDVQPHLKTFLFVTVGARVLGVYRRAEVLPASGG